MSPASAQGPRLAVVQAQGDSLRAGASAPEAIASAAVGSAVGSGGFFSISMLALSRSVRRPSVYCGFGEYQSIWSKTKTWASLGLLRPLCAWTPSTSSRRSPGR